MKTIGVLALQGGYHRHADMVKQCGANAVLVRNSEDLQACSALIMPGGESTTIGMLLKRRGMDKDIRLFLAAGKPVFGTCAGMILLSSSVDGRSELHFDALDMHIQRNFYGSQVDSFEAAVDINGPDGTIDGFQAVFIRAPRIARLSDDIQVLASFNGDPVLVKKDAVLAASFHPELTNDNRIHRMFIDSILE